VNARAAARTRVAAVRPISASLPFSLRMLGSCWDDEPDTGGQAHEWQREHGVHTFPRGQDLRRAVGSADRSDGRADHRQHHRDDFAAGRVARGRRAAHGDRRRRSGIDAWTYRRTCASVVETLPLHVGAAADSSYIDVVSGIAAQALLMRGFTTVRDAGGPVFGLKRAIDEGLVVGPRIFPSGAFISLTSGHGDYRSRYEVPRGVCGHLSHQELMGAGAIADGVGEVLRAVREQLMLGASQIKMMAGGAVVSAYDPIDVTEYTEAELRAGVEAAENWGTYVLVHAYTPRAVQQGIRAGVRCIEHGHLLDEETVAMMAEHEVWWSLQPFLDDEDAIPIPDPARRAEQLRVSNGTDTAYQLAKKHQVKLAWGTDILFDAKLASRRGAQLAKMTRWFTPPKSCEWRRRPMLNCWPCPGSATPTQADSALSRRARWPTCCSSTAIRCGPEPGRHTRQLF
jgi:Amidohydrolase family